MGEGTPFVETIKSLAQKYYFNFFTTNISNKFQQNKHGWPTNDTSNPSAKLALTDWMNERSNRIKTWSVDQRVCRLSWRRNIVRSNNYLWLSNTTKYNIFPSYFPFSLLSCFGTWTRRILSMSKCSSGTKSYNYFFTSHSILFFGIHIRFIYIIVKINNVDNTSVAKRTITESMPCWWTDILVAI